MTPSNELLLINAISSEDAGAVRRIVSDVEPGEINQLSHGFSLLATAVDVVEDAHVQDGVELSVEIIEILLEAGADADLAAQGHRSAREIALSSDVRSLRRIFERHHPSRRSAWS